MANIASQIKRNRQNAVRQQRNKGTRSGLKTSLRKFRLAVDAGDREQAAEAFRATARKLDKATQKGVVHSNYAANHKAKMAKKLSAL